MAGDTLEGTARLLKDWIGTPVAERKAMGERARMMFLERYDMRTNAAEIVRVFEPLWRDTEAANGQAGAL